MKMNRTAIVLSFLALIGGTSAATISLVKEDSSDLFDILKKNEVDDCRGHESVNLFGAGLRMIPKPLVNSINIRSIVLENNSISNLMPTAFEEARNLDCLNLRYNKIPFNKLMRLQHGNLRTFIVSHQAQDVIAVTDDENAQSIEIDELIPRTIDVTETRLPNLEHLDLSGIEFKRLPDYFNETFPKLTHLYLNDRGVVEIDSKFSSVLPFSLRTLYMQRNHIKEIYIEYPMNIEAIYLDGNPIGDGRIILDGNKIETLSLSGCGISSVSNLKLQAIQRLKRLNLSRNRIQELDINVFQYTPSIEILFLSHNKFTSFPYLYHLDELIDLSLSYNYISDVSFTVPLPSLKRLSLRGNKVTTIGQALFELPLLEELDLAENQLRTLGWTYHVQGYFGENLRHLDLRCNQFRRITEMWLSPLKNLRKLLIRGNPIESINNTELNRVPEMCAISVN